MRSGSLDRILFGPSGVESEQELWPAPDAPSPLLQIPPERLQHAQRDDRSCFSAKDARAKAHGREARLAGCDQFVVVETAFRADQQLDFGRQAGESRKRTRRCRAQNEPQALLRRIREIAPLRRREDARHLWGDRRR